MSGLYEGHPLSYGAGVNSTALAVLLVREGWHGPIVFSDTGADWPETVAYLDTFRTWLVPYGLELTVLGSDWRRGKHKLTLIEYCEHYRITPLPKVRWCTYCWKTEPLERWCLANGFTLGDMLLGISTDEAHRQPERIRPLVDGGHRQTAMHSDYPRGRPASAAQERLLAVSISEALTVARALYPAP